VSLESHPQGERWVRNFGGHRTTSWTRHAGNGLVDETFAMVTTRLRVVEEDDGGVSLVPISSRAWGIPLPSFLLPRVDAREWETPEGAHVFRIAISLPLVGHLVRYDGELRSVGIPVLVIRSPVV
jgi:hypothetical protein